MPHMSKMLPQSGGMGRNFTYLSEKHLDEQIEHPGIMSVPMLDLMASGLINSVLYPLHFHTSFSGKLG